jgi:hypothetical protein
MSEQARLAYLQEKLKKARGKSGMGRVLLAFESFFIAFCACFGFVGFYNPLLVVILIGGILLLVGGTADAIYWDSQRERIIEELEKMATKIP